MKAKFLRLMLKAEFFVIRHPREAVYAFMAAIGCYLCLALGVILGTL